ncbi:conjugal transfer protein MobB [Flavobacterium sp. Fl-318]|uniref:Conjugal transfer protein MobB n=1 Tax=Flavobacterium cupriresistens TaxID=2893885 RepID=A0ABU4R858_9FLAO|nr:MULTISPECIES: conjugal transfer protein MobB [unclassified Flavobacterium]MDX6187809.1 conjugal transfer protein MobB [Flavobacterium sp. Fl-318]UFH42269.1 relaxase/mobilization nuclease domain-containing protein [Flavobacterium sp. F-323]
MVAKIGRGQNLTGVLSYNQLKVEKEKAEVLFTHKILETPDGHYSIHQMFRSFEPYLLANRKTEKAVLHISINPNPKDNVSDEKFNVIAEEYMQKMGYGEQPFVVFKHTDIERTHIHIVSVCVDEQGRKISDSYERMRSMDICRDLEKKYGLIVARENEQQQNNKTFAPVDYKANDLKSHVASVVRYLPKYYHFQSLGEYNALLSLFNITVEEVKGELHGKPKNGLVYFALNENGAKGSNPFKASLFGKTAGHQHLQNHFEESKVVLKQNDTRLSIKGTIETALKTTTDEQDFKKQLAEKGINVVVLRNDTGRIYGITFIDHNSKTVWNGSRLGKEFSANVFNEWWNKGLKPEVRNSEDTETIINKPVSESLPAEKTHDLFNFLSNHSPVHSDDSHSSIEGFGGLLPESQGEDYQEQDFANKMKKKKKRKRGQ